MQKLHPHRRLDRDHELQRRIQTFLANRNFPGLRRLRVHVDNGVVVVSGRVHTFHEKQVATACCQRVAGVLKVLNEITVVDRTLARDNTRDDLFDQSVQ